VENKMNNAVNRAIALDDRMVTKEVKRKIMELDPNAEFDPIGNPMTLWLHTHLNEEQLEQIEGVSYAIVVT
jgi:hypothetical protein